MSDDTLTEWYRKYRPAGLKKIIGQDEVVAQVREMIAKQAVPHAILLSGPSGCLRGDTMIYDPTDGSTVSIRQRWIAAVPFHVLSLGVSGRMVVGAAMPPVRYPKQIMYRLDTAEVSFFVTGQHRILLSTGQYQEVSKIASQISFSEIQLSSIWGTAPAVLQQDEFDSQKTEEGFSGDCPLDSHFCDGRLLSGLDTYPVVSPSPDDVPERSPQRLLWGGLGTKQGHTHPCLDFVPLSTMDFLNRCFLFLFSLFSSALVSFVLLYGLLRKSVTGRVWTFLFDTELQSSGLLRERKSVLSNLEHTFSYLVPPKLGMVVSSASRVTKVEELGQEEYFDFHVSVYNNYWCGGLIHHNCGKTTVARIIKESLNCSDLDFYEENCADNRGIDTAREIRDRMGRSCLGGSSRVWLLDEFQQATSQMSSAMLKLLEDTPKWVYFLLATTDPHKLLRTIRTRCTELTFKPIQEGQLRQLLVDISTEEHVDIAYDAITEIAKVAEGSARKAIVLLQQVCNLKDDKARMDLIQSEDTKATSIDLCRALMSPKTKWGDVAKILLALPDGEDVERVRHHILSYANTILLKSGSGYAATVIDSFEKPLYDSHRPGLTLCCWAAMTNRGK